jgi:hypothetical protein
MIFRFNKKKDEDDNHHNTSTIVIDDEKKTDNKFGEKLEELSEQLQRPRFLN